MRRTKIVCTIGPGTNSPEMLEKLVIAGMNVARLNFSHGSHEDHGKVIQNIRKIEKKLGQSVAILLDLSGPKIRIGMIPNGPIKLVNGKKYILTSRDIEGNDKEVSLTYKKMPKEVKPGHRLLLADGTLQLKVLSSDGENIECEVIDGGELSSKKGVNLPDTDISAPAMTEKDKVDLMFGLEQDVDYVALSFVRDRADVARVNDIINKSGKKTELIAKIERNEALDNIDEILEEVDGIMVARGDLGVEVPVETVPLIQKKLITKANLQAKIVITATQMLESMIECPVPTRAEVTDVANAILDGTGSVMLSGETAVGKFPIKAVEMMVRIAENTETSFPYHEWNSKFGRNMSLLTEESIAHSACEISDQIDASAIVCFSNSGSTMKLIAKYRPSQPVFVLTSDLKTYRKLGLVWGAIPIFMKESDKLEDMEQQAIHIAQEYGNCKVDENLVITAGFPLYKSGTTNLINVSKIK